MLILRTLDFTLILAFPHFHTTAIALTDVAKKVLLNVAGMGNEITASIAGMKDAYQRKWKICGMNLKNYCSIFKTFQLLEFYDLNES